MKLNYKPIALHMITIGAWGCFLVGLLLAIMSNGHGRSTSNPLNHHMSIVIPAVNSQERMLFDADVQEKETKKKRLYSKMYTRVSLKADPNAFVRSKSRFNKLSKYFDDRHWLWKILFRK